MSTKSKIAALAALVTIVAAPAFAGDQDLATELQDSGRYVPQVSIQSGAYASARNASRAHASQWQAPDFQLEGR